MSPHPSSTYPTDDAAALSPPAITAAAPVVVGREEAASQTTASQNTASQHSALSSKKFPGEPGIYNRVFWWAYFANLMLVSANTLTFRFAELINMLGGTQQLAGMIVSVGAIGALLGRLFLGQIIDRYGVRRLWLGCSMLYITGLVLMISIPELGFSMYAGRLLFALGLGGMLACSMTHIQNQVPAHRRTEMIATLGSSGFLGMMVGAQLGDVLFQFTPGSMTRYLVLFGTSAGLGVIYTLIVLGITRNEKHEPAHERISAWPLLVRYWPGWVLLVAVTLGVGFAGSTVFLTRYATSLGLRGVGTYFTAYAISAFCVRIWTRGASRVYGRNKLIVYGMLGHIASFWGLCFVTQEWHFLLPALCGGFGHALIFPCVVSLATETFPIHYRGTATTLALAVIDLGSVISAPLLGSIIDHWGFDAMFIATALWSMGVTLIYYFTNGAKIDPETLDRHGNEQAHLIPDPAATEPVIFSEPADHGESRVETAGKA